jgi:hypothetical protein
MKDVTPSASWWARILSATSSGSPSDDGRLVQRLLVRQRQEVLAHAPVELVRLGRDALGLGDQPCLRLEEPPDRLAQLLARLA